MVDCAACEVGLRSTCEPTARLLGRTQWPGTAASLSRSPEPSQTAGKPTALEEPPSSALGTPHPTCMLRTSLFLHLADASRHDTHRPPRAAPTRR